jgi:hypothetical protein
MHLSWIVALLLIVAIPAPAADSAARLVPAAHTNHPGNIFLAGEDVRVPLAGGEASVWRVCDYDDHELASVRIVGGFAALGRLPVGFYRLREDGHSNWVSCAVLSPLTVPTPLSSPIALDVAMAWFYPTERMNDVSSLCALAGVNWVRDRLTWAELEPSEGRWTKTNRYDDSALAQSRAGLQVLQVMHSSPPWANPKASRFPLDLRHAYRFHREIAQRWRGQVRAFEPWNEADIPMFGGHTGSEMATMQKASYLGLKAGNPEMIACLNVFALHNRLQLADLNENRAWPYFDRFDLHHYAPFEDYPKLYADFRAVAAGKPLWVTECALPVKWVGDELLKEPSDADLRVQAERIAKTFACSLHEGSAMTFYFMLPHYVEGQTQFGLLRPDLTPRPAYVALAAVGRLLADAQPLGRWHGGPDAVQAFLFRAKPDGRNANVLVAWSTNGAVNFSLPSSPEAVFDHVGRTQPVAPTLALASAPVFAMFPDEAVTQMRLQPPVKPLDRLPGERCPVVIQAVWPEERIVLSRSAYRLSSEKRESIPLFVYNFSDKPVSGRLRVTVPRGWQTSVFQELEIAPQSRAELQLELDCRKGMARAFETVRVNGSFGAAGESVLSMRVAPDPNLLGRQSGIAIAEADEASRWQPTISGGGRCRIVPGKGEVIIDAEPVGADKWIYPMITLAPQQRPPAGTAGLAFTLALLEGEGTFRALLEEKNGSTYMIDLLTQPEAGKTVEGVAMFEDAVLGAGWSRPDPNGRFDSDGIISIKIGCNTPAAKVKFSLKNLRWITADVAN